MVEGSEGRQAGHFHGCEQGATGSRFHDSAVGPDREGGSMTGRYRITMLPLLDNGVARVWESEKRTAQRWHLFAETCRSLAADGLDYSVSFALTGDNPHILITASGKATVKRK